MTHVGIRGPRLFAEMRDEAFQWIIDGDRKGDFFKSRTAPMMIPSFSGRL